MGHLKKKQAIPYRITKAVNFRIIKTFQMTTADGNNDFQRFNALIKSTGDKPSWVR